MGFKLAELLAERPILPLDRCATGKTVYSTKAAARAAVTDINQKIGTPMKAFRCGFCDRYHLGHRRGARRN
jgi:hypothetical protein